MSEAWDDFELDDDLNAMMAAVDAAELSAGMNTLTATNSHVYSSTAQSLNASNRPNPIPARPLGSVQQRLVFGQSGLLSAQPKSSGPAAPLQPVRNSTNVPHNHSSTNAASIKFKLKPVAPSQPGTYQWPMLNNGNTPSTMCNIQHEKSDMANQIQQGDPSAVSSLNTHAIDEKELETWIYPINYPLRDYQFNIISRALFANTLVALPTGLGKTFLAAVVMYNYYRWFPEGKIIFMAPTKPLVAQQIEACFKITGIHQDMTYELTGTTKSETRIGIWKQKRVFFLTPQVMQNDLRSAACSADKVVLLVVDEAHRATGNYAYCEVIRELSKASSPFRVLALSATPGSDMKAVQHVVNNLLIQHIEIRTEDSFDIRPFIFSRQIEEIIVSLTPQITRIVDAFAKVVSIFLVRLCNHGVFYEKDPRAVSRYALLDARKRWIDNHKDANRAQISSIMNDSGICMAMCAALQQLQTYGIRSFYDTVSSFLAEAPSEKNSRSRSELVENSDLKALMIHVNEITKSPDFSSHPKLDRLVAVVLEHFSKELPDNGDEGSSDASLSKSRVMIFSQYRDNVDEIVTKLNQHHPFLRVMSFIGQSSSKSGKKGKGFTQKEQLEVISKFQSGNYNVLVSTSIGEEGLDIGDVDLIVCYDAQTSPVRMLQRMGRTGRKRQGRIVVILSKGKEEEIHRKAQAQYKSIQRAIMDGQGKRIQMYSGNLSRIIPSNARPVCDKRELEIAQYERSKSNTLSKTKMVTKKPSISSLELESLITADRQRYKSASLKYTDLSIGRFAYWQTQLLPEIRLSRTSRSVNFVQMIQLCEELGIEEDLKKSRPVIEKMKSDLCWTNFLANLETDAVHTLDDKYCCPVTTTKPLDTTVDLDRQTSENTLTKNKRKRSYIIDLLSSGDDDDFERINSHDKPFLEAESVSQVCTGMVKKRLLHTNNADPSTSLHEPGAMQSPAPAICSNSILADTNASSHLHHNKNLNDCSNNRVEIDHQALSQNTLNATTAYELRPTSTLNQNPKLSENLPPIKSLNYVDEPRAFDINDSTPFDSRNDYGVLSTSLLHSQAADKNHSTLSNTHSNQAVLQKHQEHTVLQNNQILHATPDVDAIYNGLSSDDLTRDFKPLHQTSSKFHQLCPEMFHLPVEAHLGPCLEFNTIFLEELPKHASFNSKPATTSDLHLKSTTFSKTEADSSCKAIDYEALFDDLDDLISFEDISDTELANISFSQYDQANITNTCNDPLADNQHHDNSKSPIKSDSIKLHQKYVGLKPNSTTATFSKAATSITPISSVADEIKTTLVEPSHVKSPTLQQRHLYDNVSNSLAYIDQKPVPGDAAPVFKTPRPISRQSNLIPLLSPQIGDQYHCLEEENRSETPGFEALISSTPDSAPKQIRRFKARALISEDEDDQTSGGTQISSFKGKRTTEGTYWQGNDNMHLCKDDDAEDGKGSDNEFSKRPTGRLKMLLERQANKQAPQRRAPKQRGSPIIAVKQPTKNSIPSRFKKRKKEKVRAECNPFLDIEAQLSSESDVASSDENYESGADSEAENSFVVNDDELSFHFQSQKEMSSGSTASVVDMHAFYRSSLLSPCLGGLGRRSTGARFRLARMRQESSNTKSTDGSDSENIVEDEFDDDEETYETNNEDRKKESTFDLHHNVREAPTLGLSEPLYTRHASCKKPFELAVPSKLTPRTFELDLPCQKNFMLDDNDDFEDIFPVKPCKPLNRSDPKSYKPNQSDTFRHSSLASSNQDIHAYHPQSNMHPNTHIPQPPNQPLQQLVKKNTISDTFNHHGITATEAADIQDILEIDWGDDDSIY
ncbi:3'-5' DNA helicase [Batrachochytrium dendrobatidis]|nr:3'-5' DNA helicase [Batrachochytrium dendrobatidis]